MYELFGASFCPVSKGKIALLILGKVLLVYLMFLAGCATNRQSVIRPFSSTGPPEQETGEYGDEISHWDDIVSGGKPRIVIALDEQRAYFYRGNRIVGVSIVSTGREGYDTPSGEFHVVQKDLTHVSSIYGDYVDRSGQVVMKNVDATKDPRPHGTVFRGAPMPYFLRIHGGIGMHAGYLPGYPASHGCIRLPKEMAARFYENSAVGTPVAIRQEPRYYGPGALDGERYSPLTDIMER
jgi:lipoprotein-anchoring transpeptidase ErfK/SrfK